MVTVMVTIHQVQTQMIVGWLEPQQKIGRDVLTLMEMDGRTLMEVGLLIQQVRLMLSQPTLHSGLTLMVMVLVMILVETMLMIAQLNLAVQ